MFGRRKRLLLLGLGLVAVAGLSGCEQAEDVVSPVSRTQISLSPQLLPSTPPGMVYELFVAPTFDITTDTTQPDGAVSIGRFRYDNTLVRFLDTAGTPRADGNKFVLNDDFLNFGKIFISVDTLNDPDAGPGPIMLMDDATDPFVNVIKLVLPLTSTEEGDQALWDRTVSFNMETTSNYDRGSLDGYGIWFSRYQLTTGTVQDTFNLNGYTLDSIYLEEIIDDANDPNPDDIIDSIVVESIDTVAKQFGLETRNQVVVDFTIYRQPGIFVPDSNKFLVTTADLDWALGPVDTFQYDNFFLVDTEWFAYPGWSYRGWVVSPKVTEAVFGEPVDSFTPPAFSLFRGGYDFLPGRNGGMISTGPFKTIQNGTDLANPYASQDSATVRLPNLPGEDFLDLPSGNSLELVPRDVGELGSAFITLEPDNFVNRNTNFPLLIFTRRLPIAPPPSVPFTPGDSLHYPDTLGRIERFDMINWARTNDPNSGAPSVLVNIVRQ